MNPGEHKNALSKSEGITSADKGSLKSEAASDGSSSLRRKVHKTKGFATVNGVLNEVVTKLNLDRRLKEHALLNLWPQLVGDEMKAKSRPLFIDTERNLVVAVKDASAGQELSLTKPGILRQLKLLAQGIGLSVKGLRFDLKHFHAFDQSCPEPPSLNESFKSLLKMQPTKEALEAISLSEEDMQELSVLAKNLANAQAVETHKEQAMASRVLRLFEKELKLRQWRKLNGFPACSLCQLPTSYSYGKDALCSNCYYLSYIK